MSINIRVCERMISMKRKENKKLNKKLSIDEQLEVPAKKSPKQIDDDKNGKNCSKRKKDIFKKKERSKHKLIKLEKRYKYLENICYEYISPKDDQYKSVLETDNSKSTNRSVSTLLKLTRQVLRLEQEVNAVLFSGQGNDYNCKSSNDDYEMTDFLLKLNKVKKRLVDEFDLNVSSHLENGSTVNSEFQKSWSNFSDDDCGGDIEGTTTVLASSRLDEQMIDMLTEEILMDLKKSSSSISSNSAIHDLDECKQNKPWSASPVLADLPKIPPSFSRNSLLYRGNPPASLICSNYKRLNIDFTIHELSAIYETDSEFSRSQMATSNLK